MRNFAIALILGMLVLCTGAPAATPIGGAFALTDQDGKQAASSDFEGKFRLIFFGFTRCPDLCPATLLTLSQVMKELKGNAKRLIPIFITLDPQHDTPAELKSYLGHFDPAIIGLTGTQREIGDVEKNYKVYSARGDDKSAPGGYSITHSGTMYLMDAKGGFLTVFAADSKPEEIAAKIREYLKNGL